MTGVWQHRKVILFPKTKGISETDSTPYGFDKSGRK